MKIFNKLFVASAFVLSAFTTAAAQEKLTVEPITVAPGEVVEVTVNYESTVKHSGYQIDINLPEGLSFVKNEKEKYDIVLGTSASTHQAVAKVKEEVTPKKMLYVVFDLDKADLENGSLFTFKVKADEELAEKSEITFDNLKFNDATVVPSFAVEVTKSQATGISDAVVAGSESEIIYNMAGQRVSSKTKGIVIKNGKKVINK